MTPLTQQRRPTTFAIPFVIHDHSASLLAGLFKSLLESRYPGSQVTVSDEHQVGLSAGDLVIENLGNGRVLRVWKSLPDDATVAKHLQAGQSLLATDATQAEALAAIDSLQDGPAFTALGIVKALAQSHLKLPEGWRPTARQGEILKLLMLGQSNSEIAKALNISPHTVRTHLQSIARELGATSRGKLVAIVRERGLG